MINAPTILTMVVIDFPINGNEVGQQIIFVSLKGAAKIGGKLVI